MLYSYYCRLEYYMSLFANKNYLQKDKELGPHGLSYYIIRTGSYIWKCTIIININISSYNNIVIKLQVFLLLILLSVSNF